MPPYPVDLEIRAGENPIVIFNDGTREPLPTWMRRKLNQCANVSHTERTRPSESKTGGDGPVRNHTGPGQQFL